MPVPAGPLPPVVVPGSPENVQNGKDLLALWRWLLDQRPKMTDPTEGPEVWSGDRWAGMPMVSPMQPPKDAKDPHGAKAPGKPGAVDGFEDPKDGEQWVQAPNGKGYGWLHKNGDVWVPTGWAGAPGSGTTGPAHGGPHWDVQSPDGKHRNVRP